MYIQENPVHLKPAIEFGPRKTGKNQNWLPLCIQMYVKRNMHRLMLPGSTVSTVADCCWGTNAGGGVVGAIGCPGGPGAGPGPGPEPCPGGGPNGGPKGGPKGGKNDILISHSIFKKVECCGILKPAYMALAFLYTMQKPPFCSYQGERFHALSFF